MNPETNAPDAGRALNGRIAETLFGWGRWTGPTGVRCFGPSDGGHRDTPDYSTDIADAWQVVEEARRRGFAVFVGGRPDAWEVEIIGPAGLSWQVDDQPTAPLAICLAALQSLATATTDAPTGAESEATDE